MAVNDPITTTEVETLFGNDIPLEARKLLFQEYDHHTPDAIRVMLTAIKNAPPPEDIFAEPT